ARETARAHPRGGGRRTHRRRDDRLGRARHLLLGPALAAAPDGARVGVRRGDRARLRRRTAPPADARRFPRRLRPGPRVVARDRAVDDRDWQPDVARLAWADVAGERITLHNIRNFDYRTET